MKRTVTTAAIAALLCAGIVFAQSSSLDAVPTHTTRQGKLTDLVTIENLEQLMGQLKGKN